MMKGVGYSRARRKVKGGGAAGAQCAGGRQCCRLRLVPGCYNFACSWAGTLRTRGARPSVPHATESEVQRRRPSWASHLAAVGASGGPAGGASPTTASSKYALPHMSP